MFLEVFEIETENSHYDAKQSCKETDDVENSYEVLVFFEQNYNQRPIHEQGKYDFQRQNYVHFNSGFLTDIGF